MIDINIEINRLIKYGLDKKLINEEDSIYVINKLLILFNLNGFEKCNFDELPLKLILEHMTEYAYNYNLIKDNNEIYLDMFKCLIMDCLLPRPSEIIKKFYNLYEGNSKAATDYFYSLSLASNYIKSFGLNNHIYWKANTKYGLFDITINLIKPEYNSNTRKEGRYFIETLYPKCLICHENEGYVGSLYHPPRSNHRVIPVEINNESWFIQYSPYVYFEKHTIVIKEKHEPMMINEDTFKCLLDFIDLFPHYFVGSNADLPIVGGSILEHAHFQSGEYSFPIEYAKTYNNYKIEGYEKVEVSILKWPLSVIRLRSKDRKQILNLAVHILNKWIYYSDESVDILSHSNNIRHNTITPVVRKQKDAYEMDLFLRNNRTNDKYPNGIFHPHKESYHVLNENIGLIEAMGYAILPKHLKNDFHLIKECLLGTIIVEDNEVLKKHEKWITYLKGLNLDNDLIHQVIQDEVAKIFERCLADAGVFKQTKEGLNAFKKFIESL